MRNKLNKGCKMYHICAKSADYSAKAYVLLFGSESMEFIPKSRCSFLQQSDGSQEYGYGVAMRWYTIPEWILLNLKGKAEYKITK